MEDQVAAGTEARPLGHHSAAPRGEEDGEEEEEAASKPPTGSCDPRPEASRHGLLGQPKRKHRRRPSKKKRRWKPYFKLSWEEKKQLDERESVRAAKTRAEMFAKGFTVAPYNTTQFLMEEHNQEEPDLNTGVCPKRLSKSDETSEEEELDEEDQDSGSDGMGGNGSEFLQRDFSETYEKYHAETLQNMSKQELIQEYLELEKCLSRLEDENNRLRCRLEGKKAVRSAEAAEIQMKQIEHQVEMLKAENQRLEKENEQYKQEGCLVNGQ
ncbi:protein HEXIM1-like [Rhinoraja longicauda]